MAFFRWKVQKNYGLTVQMFYKGGRIVQACALFRLRHVAPLALPCGRTCALAPFRQKWRSRAFSAPFAPSLALLPPVLGWLGFPHAAPPATPLQNPLPSGYSVNFMGGVSFGGNPFSPRQSCLAQPLRRRSVGVRSSGIMARPSEAASAGEGQAEGQAGQPTPTRCPARL